MVLSILEWNPTTRLAVNGKNITVVCNITALAVNGKNITAVCNVTALAVNGKNIIAVCNVTPTRKLSRLASFNSMELSSS
jgi:hypothetical protein